MTMMRLFCLLLLCLFANPTIAEQPYKLVKVTDGDTVTLSDRNGKFKLRLTGIDAPERNQAYGKKSRRALIKLCKQKNVTITAHITGKDRYQRYLGRLYCNRVDASLHLTKLGLAWHNYKYSSDMTIFIAHVKARYAKIGLWTQKKPLPPWEWRRKYQKKYSANTAKR